MMIDPIFRFGILPGSALILTALFDTINNLAYIVIDYGGVIADSMQHGIAPESAEIAYLIRVMIQLACTFVFLWYGTILKGSKKMLLSWIFISLAFFILDLFTLFALVFTNWSTLSGIDFLEILYFILFCFAIFVYPIYLMVKCLPYFGFIDELTPIGKGARFIIDYYKSHAKEAAGLVLMLEIICNAEIFLGRQIAGFIFGHEFMGHENYSDAAVFAEETIIRYIRIGLSIVGFYLTYKEKKYWMFRWSLCYLGTIAASTGIFIYLLFAWRAEHVILTLTYFCISSLSLLYRTGLLFVCTRYTDVFERSGIPM